MSELVTEIRPRLWLGAWEAAHAENANLKYDRIICVTEDWPTQEPTWAIHIPILRRLAAPPWLRAQTAQLDAVALLIEEYWAKRQQRLLLHCGHGIERAPLALVWFFVTKLLPEGDAGLWTLTTAYDHLCALRPDVQRRLEWLAPRERERYA